MGPIAGLGGGGAQSRRRRHWRLMTLPVAVLAALTVHLAGAALPNNDAQLQLDAYAKALDEMRARPGAFDLNMLCAAAATHGQVDKVALHTSFPWPMWSRARRRTLPPHIPIYAPPTIFASRTLRVIYVRQQKSSSSSILAALKEMACKNPANCTEDEFSERSITRAEWRSFLVFTWVRNPWMRIFSGYTFMCTKFMRTRTRNASEPGPPCCVTLEAFTTDPYAMVDACGSMRCCIWNNNDWDFRFIKGHINDQVHTIQTASGEWMVDFIGRSEFMEADWAEFVALLNKRAGTRFVPKPMPVRNYAEPSAIENGTFVECLGRSVPGADAATMRNIALQFALDLKQLGYIAM